MAIPLSEININYNSCRIPVTNLNNPIAMKNLAICLLLLLGAVGCGDDYVVYETVDTMVCIPKNDFQVLEYDAASGQACVYDLYLYKGGYNDDGITVKLVVDPSVLDVYNVESGLELKVMPDRYFAFDPEVRLSGTGSWTAPKSASMPLRCLPTALIPPMCFAAFRQGR